MYPSLRVPTFVELLAPQSVVNRVSALALKSGVSIDLIFANQNCILFSWSTQDINHEANPNPTLVVPYPDIPAKMPGVLLERHLSTHTAH
jgi:hypothetical protein